MFRLIHGTERVIDSVALAIHESFARRSFDGMFVKTSLIIKLS